MDDRNKKNIRSLFKELPEVVAIYLFGSEAKGRVGEHSDVDLALLLRPGMSLPFDEQMALKSRLETLLKKDVDLVILNLANPILKHQVFAAGPPLLNKDPRYVNEFFVRSLNEYVDLKRVRYPIEQSILKGRVYG